MLYDIIEQNVKRTGNVELDKKIALYGFNNLTKSLSFNIYDVCYAETQKDKNDYLIYIDEQYNSERLTNILCTVTDIIGAHVLNISKQDYEPRGASAAIASSSSTGMCSSTVSLLDLSSRSAPFLPRCAASLPRTSLQ